LCGRFQKFGNDTNNQNCMHEEIKSRWNARNVC
jgi:hypothetical protein